MLEGYTKDNIIDLKTLPIIDKHVRINLLKWISKAIASPGKTAKTEDGRVFKLIVPDNGTRTVLRCYDGDLDMPAYVLKFSK